MKDNIVRATIEIYQQMQVSFKPTPAKSHYTYNLRDVSKVFQGMTKSKPAGIKKDDDMVKLWIHEAMRVFADRLISIEDRSKFTELIKIKMKERFKKDWDKVVTIEPILFGSFTPLILPAPDANGNQSKNCLKDIYCELFDMDKVHKECVNKLDEFNQTHKAKKMDLVLFLSAIEHIVKIHRIITTEFGHALLVGVGGSGRKSLTELATYIADFQIYTLEITKGYDYKQWRDDLKENLFIPSGCEDQPIVFSFSDTQILFESFVEDINNILNIGEVPNMYNAEDLGTIYEAIKDQKKNDSDFK